VSVAKALFGSLAGGHTTALAYQSLFSEYEFNNYFKFAFVRNPWDRLVSAYFFLKRGGMNPADASWAQRALSKCPDFDTFVKNWLTAKNIYSGVHFIPQYEFLCIGGVPVVDFLGRFESLAHDFEIIKNKLGIQAKLLRTNSSVRKSYEHYYTDETREIVRKVYEIDVQLFAYEFEGID
jgi:hypothetical protein